MYALMIFLFKITFHNHKTIMTLTELHIHLDLSFEANRNPNGTYSIEVTDRNTWNTLPLKTENDITRLRNATGRIVSDVVGCYTSNDLKEAQDAFNERIKEFITYQLLNNPPTNEKKNRKCKPIKVLREGEDIPEIFDSIDKACTYYGFNKTAVYNHLQKRSKTVKSKKGLKYTIEYV